MEHPWLALASVRLLEQPWMFHQSDISVPENPVIDGNGGSGCFLGSDLECVGLLCGRFLPAGFRP